MGKNALIALIIAFLLLLGGGIYFVRTFLRSFAPPEITITANTITTDDYFVNGVTIEKLVVDSIGAGRYPVRYTVVYKTHCGLVRGENTKPLDRISFKEAGPYTWSEDTTRTRYENVGMSREPLDSISKTWWLAYYGEHAVCPLKFEVGQWYLALVSDPRITGIYFYMDWQDKVHQFTVHSGVSPI
ncbi:MAG: hypothetical protein EOO09_17295 [Chitinophagaceae bacterium]|nr:MAG: hypothetical protein EOO09_17295 [Chitinophagaceae bacterium]